MDVPLDKRRQLRRNATLAEEALWRHLRGRRFNNYKVRRQHPCGDYILDFFCYKRRLAIELDGGQHFTPRALEYDARRTSYLNSRGIHVLRFGSDVMLANPKAVLVAIADALGFEWWADD